MTQSKQEYVAASLREQIKNMNEIMQEMESEKLERDAIVWRLRTLELNMRRLREAA